METLQHWQDLIKQRRKLSTRRSFILDVWSRAPMMFYKNWQFISRFPPNTRPKKLISHADYEGYAWSFEEFWVDVGGSSSNFFSTFSTLYENMPFTPMFTYGWSENCDYVDRSLNAKNSYLSSTIINNVENALYSFSVKENCHDVLNSAIVWNESKYVFASRLVISSYEVFYSQHIVNSSNIWYSDNLVWCQRCVRCKNLDNKSYCIDNIEYPKSEFFDKLPGALLEYWKNHVRSSVETNIECINSENILFGYQLKDSRNCAMVWWKYTNTNIFDWMNAGWSNSWENYDYYWVLWWGNWSHDIYCCVAFLQSSFLFYSMNMTNCSFCLWCIGLKNKSYCIFNKQYTKEERHEKVDEIFSQMEKDWTLWEFFPWTMNPFYFNDTAAFLIDPTFTKEEVTAKWYLRRDEPIKVDIPLWVQTISTHELDAFERLSEGWKLLIDEEILKKVIVDDVGNTYRIIPMELDFLRKYWLPLPRKHWLERMKDNFRI
jgi:hypothetical protein